MVELREGGVLHIGPLVTVTLGILVLFVGKAMNQRYTVLRRFNIPEPVTGGLLFSLAACLLYLVVGITPDFELTARNVLLVYFFTTIGINARVADLRAGGRPLAVLLGATAVFMVLQNLVGVGAALLFGRPAVSGLLVGSVALMGGHGTAIAWAPDLAARLHYPGAAAIGLLTATAGLVLASIAGGPLARFLIRRHRLEADSASAPDVGVRYETGRPEIDYFAFLRAILAIHVCVIIGVIAHTGLEALGITLPLFVTCLMAGIVLTNLLPLIAPVVSWPSHSTALALIAEVSLGTFLAMSLMSMQLWTLAELAGPIVVALGLQLGVTIAFAAVIVFPLLRRNYDAAVISAGFVGFGLGATPTAMANMTAVTQRHGASPVAFLVVPLVGAFFIDILNALVIRLFVAVL